MRLDKVQGLSTVHPAALSPEHTSSPRAQGMVRQAESILRGRQQYRQDMNRHVSEHRWGTPGDPQKSLGEMVPKL